MKVTLPTLSNTFNHFAVILASTFEMKHSDWLSYRTVGIGGSDVAPISGVSRYGGAFSVYMQKIEGFSQEDNDAMLIGRLLEPAIGELFSIKQGKRIERAPYILAHPDNQHYRANIDFWVPDENVGLECKNAGHYSKEQWEDGNVPDEYYLQCQWYMFVANTPYWYLQALVGGNQPVMNKIMRNDAVIQKLVENATDFLENHLLPKVPPAPDSSDRAKEYLTAMYPEVSENLIAECDCDALEQLIERYHEGADLVKQGESLKKEANNNILALMGEAQHAWGRNRKIKRSKIEVAERVQTVKAYSYIRLFFSKA